MSTKDTSLILRVLTSQGELLRTTVDVDVRHLTLGERIALRAVDASQEIAVAVQRPGEYEVTVTPLPASSFEPHRQTISVPAVGATPAILTFVFPPGTFSSTDEPPSETYLVTGRVASPDRAGVGGLRVVVVDKNVGGDFALQTTPTDDGGSYSAQFDGAVIRERGKSKPDLQARVYRGDSFLGASDVRYNAGERETLDVLLPAGGATASTLPSEYESLHAAILPHYAHPLADLEENAERQDITFLANKAGWDARAVALGALAEQFSRNDGTGESIDPAFYYALFRAGLPANADALYTTDAAAISRVLRESLDSGVIPRRLEQKLPQAMEAYAKVSAQTRLFSPPGIGVSSLRDMLAVARLDDEAQAQFAALLAQHSDDPDVFWHEVGRNLGETAAARLQVDGKLAFLTLNNAPLIDAVHRLSRAHDLRDPVQLAEQGLHRAEKWQELLGSEVEIPAEIPGETADEKRLHYSEYLAAQVRIAYPTASVAEMVGTTLPGGAGVRDFLSRHQADFVIGMQPVEQFIDRQGLDVPPETVSGVKRLHRLYQITPSDQAMTVLARSDVHSAYDVVAQPRKAFVERFALELGLETANLTYDRAAEVHNAALNVAVGFLQAISGIELGFGQVLQPAPLPPSGANAGDILAYTTMEKLFGTLDFCACDHCRSVLSPAAYLVDLLHFLDHPASGGAANPQQVLFARRPDIQHLPLTCENTNTALPYIDVVNETLEYFIANHVRPLSLQGYLGHDIDGSASADLLATPQFVIDEAYTILAGETFPPPLPFHRPLELLRACCEKLQAPLPLAMERLRKGDDLAAVPYGWNDVLIEELCLSRREHQILTDHVAVPLAALYGFPAGTSDGDVIAAISNAKTFARRVGVTYEELVALLRTRFVNPASDLLPRLDKLGVKVPVIVNVVDVGDQASITLFSKSLPRGAATPDPADFGGDVLGWAIDPQNFARLMTLIVLSSPDPDVDSCDFELLELRRARPAAGPLDTSNRLDAVAFTRLMRFIRLWRKTGWTMEQTDAAICALGIDSCRQLVDADVESLAALDQLFRTLLPRLGVVLRVMQALDLGAARDLLPLLACWSDIGTFGPRSLYQQLFLNPTVLRQDAVFAADRHGEYLRGSETLSAHAEALRAALNLTGSEYKEIFSARGFGDSTPLSIPIVSTLFRFGYLARKLRLTVRELVTLVEVTGLDPFTPPDFTGLPPQPPPMLRLIDFVQAFKARGMKAAEVLYLIWNEDLSGKSAPERTAIVELARTLRNDYADIESQLAATEAPGGDVVHARMALIYGEEVADAFLALLDDTIGLDVPYTQVAAVLDPAVLAIDPKLTYDAVRDRLGRQGLLPATTRDALADLPATADLLAAVEALLARGDDAAGSFFTRHAELRPLYAAYVASTDPPEEKRRALLVAFKPDLARRRKRQQALQRLSAAAKVELPFAQTLLDAPAPPYPLHASLNATKPALEEALALEMPGLTFLAFHRDTATGDPDLTVSAAPNLDYAPQQNPLPENPTPGAPISAIWRGQLEAPESGFYNLVVETDAGATVLLTLGGEARALARSGALWRNQDALELAGGKLYEIELRVDAVKDVVNVRWETPKRPRETIPARYLWPADVVAPFVEIYERFLKVTRLAAALKLTAGELAHFGSALEEQIASTGWLNVLPVGDDHSPTRETLGIRFRTLLDFARIKAEVSPDDEQVFGALAKPSGAAAVMQWDAASLAALLAHFGFAEADLTRLAVFARLHDAMALVRTLAVPASALVAAVTNDPTPASVRDFQHALRARYPAEDWRALVQPINDRLRARQRDALVAHVLHRFRSDPATEHINTPDKLFEYFLMDVAMEPCMQTSRIRHALSSVQLFIERCLLNLETRVSPSAIDAAQWEWMKRYRVWEANRKVFLYPENWLEPELRDDKSPFFKEIESELLQSDITDDAAAAAVLNYLAKLEEVARLEPCGLWRVPADAQRGTREVVHVIGRTAGAHRKYFYRRREGLTWTPWEPVKADIEDNPVLPIVWNGRLLLFWLRLTKEGPPAANRPPAGKKLIDLSTDNVPADPQVMTKAVLCWSEYYNGKWQAAKTSDPNDPLTVATTAVPRTAFRLLATFAAEDALRLYVQVQGGVAGAFVLHNTHSLPSQELLFDKVGQLVLPLPDYRHQRSISYSAFHVDDVHVWFTGETSATNAHHQVCLPNARVDVLEPKHPWASRDDPFFISDSRHVFYVTSREEPAPLWSIPTYGFLPAPTVTEVVTIPPVVLRPPLLQIPPKPSWEGGGVVGPNPGVVDPAPIERFVSEDAYIRHGLGTPGTIVFGDAEIGPAGAIRKPGGAQ